jgi:hypothetical protein
MRIRTRLNWLRTVSNDQCCYRRLLTFKFYYQRVRAGNTFQLKGRRNRCHKNLVRTSISALGPASGVEHTATSIFFYLVCEATGTAATPGLLCQPRLTVKMIVETQMECRLAGETEVLGENLPPAPLLFITKSHMTRPGFEPGPPPWETGD